MGQGAAEDQGDLSKIIPNEEDLTFTRFNGWNRFGRTCKPLVMPVSAGNPLDKSLMGVTDVSSYKTSAKGFKDEATLERMLDIKL